MWTGLISLLFLISPVFCGLCPFHTQELKRHLFSSYDSTVRPNDEHGNVGNVSFTLKPICFNVDPYGTLYGKVWYVMSWIDSRITWNSTWGIDSLSLPHDSLWKPDIVPFKGNDGEHYSDKYPIMVFPNGKVIFIPSVHILHQCFKRPKGTFNKTINCDVPFGSWTHDGDVMNLDFFKNKPEVDISSYDFEHCPTKILPSGATREIKHYDGFPQKYITLVFHLKLDNEHKHPAEEDNFPEEHFTYKLLKP